MPCESAGHVPGSVGDEDRAALDHPARELDALAELGDRRANQPRRIEGARRRGVGPGHYDANECRIRQRLLAVKGGGELREERRGPVRVGRHRRRVRHHQAARQVAEQNAHLGGVLASCGRGRKTFYLCVGRARGGETCSGPNGFTVAELTNQELSRRCASQCLALC